jgi:hypothetical protein
MYLVRWVAGGLVVGRVEGAHQGPLSLVTNIRLEIDMT